MTVSELIRKSVRGAMDHDTDRMIKDVNAAFGAWKNRNFDTEEYLRELRRDRKPW